MSTDNKKNEKEHSVEERLKALYQLQTYLTDIDRIKTLRGELPNEVKDCEDEIARYELRVAKHNEEIAHLNEMIQGFTAAIEECRMKVARYDEQINNVRNNREFAFLEKEREYQTLEIELNEKKIRDSKARIEEETEHKNADEEALADQRHILEAKKQELEEIVSETRAEEEQIMAKAKAVEPVIDDYTLAAFRRIRLLQPHPPAASARDQDAQEGDSVRILRPHHDRRSAGRHRGGSGTRSRQDHAPHQEVRAHYLNHIMQHVEV